jgi:hypothetical protein
MSYLVSLWILGRPASTSLTQLPAASLRPIGPRACLPLELTRIFEGITGGRGGIVEGMVLVIPQRDYFKPLRSPGLLDTHIVSPFLVIPTAVLDADLPFPLSHTCLTI